MADRVNIVTPVGRLVMGSLYKPSTKDADGNPLVYKTGLKAGQARSNYFLALAIPKTGEGHWKHTNGVSKSTQLGLQLSPADSFRTASSPGKWPTATIKNQFAR